MSFKKPYFECAVQEPWFTLIQSGLKEIEGRLNKGTFASFKKGDTVKWYVRGTNKHCFTKITQIYEYDSFKDMLEAQKVNRVLPGCPDIQAGVRVYRQFYSVEKERQHKVLAIEVKVYRPRARRTTKRRSK